MSLQPDHLYVSHFSSIAAAGKTTGDTNYYFHYLKMHYFISKPSFYSNLCNITQPTSELINERCLFALKSLFFFKVMCHYMCSSFIQIGWRKSILFFSQLCYLPFALHLSKILKAALLSFSHLHTSFPESHTAHLRLQNTGEEHHRQTQTSHVTCFPKVLQTLLLTGFLKGWK